MAISNQAVIPDSPSVKSSRISISASPEHSPTIILAPLSPAPSVYVQIDDRTNDLLNSAASSRRATPTPPLRSNSQSPTASFHSEYPEGSTVGIISPRRPTFSEEKEVVFARDTSSLTSTTTTRSTKDNQRLPNAAIASGHTPSTSLSHSSNPSGKSLRSAASELAAARRASVVNAPQEEKASRVEGLGLYTERGLSNNDDVTETESEQVEDIQKIEGGRYEEAVIAAAQQAQMKRPRMFSVGPARSVGGQTPTQKAIIDHEMGKLEQGGIVVPATPKATGLEAMHDLEDISRQERTGSSGEGNSDDVLRRGIRTFPLDGQSRKFSLREALRSNPVDLNQIPKRAATVPSRPRRKTAFSIPPAVDTQLGKRFERESIVSTPYPGQGFAKYGGSGRVDEEHDLDSHVGRIKSQDPVADEMEILIILSSHDRNAPRLGHLMVPLVNHGGQEPRQDIATKSRPRRPVAVRGGWMTRMLPFVHESRRRTIGSFDDEMLCRLLVAEYSRLRGRVRVLFSARGLHGASVLIHPPSGNLDGLITHVDDYHPLTRSYQGARNAGIEAEVLVKLQEGLSKPESRRGKEEVVRYLQALNLETETDRGHMSLSLVESWSARKLSCAAAVVLLLAVAAAVLWIIFGVSAPKMVWQFAGGSGGKAVMHEGKGYRGSGGQVETGAVLGLLVLLMGWTGMAGWVWLSWLT